jgi:hypothetical protein
LVKISAAFALRLAARTAMAGKDMSKRIIKGAGIRGFIGKQDCRVGLGNGIGDYGLMGQVT